MTEYWKSYAKKFCEICKCWYADNRVSAERHEQGLRHKAMVQQRLRDSAKKARDKEVEDHDLKMTLLAMEQAARASINSREQREVPTLPAPRPFPRKPTTESDEPDARAELREQKRKLKELKRKSKQSQCWVDDEDEDDKKFDSLMAEKIADEGAGIEWVQAQTPDGQSYYWHIFTGETRWDPPERYYTTEQYTECYAEIAAETATKAHFSSISTGEPSSSTGAIEYGGDGHAMINPQFVGQMSTEEVIRQLMEGQETPHPNRQLVEEQEPPPPKKSYYGQREQNRAREREEKRRRRDGRESREAETTAGDRQLSREERRKIKRERKAMAEAEGDQIPEGLVELKYEQPEEEEPDSELKPQIKQQQQQHSHPLGPWIPVKKEEKRPDFASLDTDDNPKKKRSSKHYDDLPEQEYGPGTAMLSQTPAELLELSELDPDDLAFGAKQQQETNKKSKKLVGFRKPATGSSNKSLRNKIV